jgi:hypothetical protein
MAKRSTSKREIIDTGRNEMYAKRRADETFKEIDDVGRSSFRIDARAQTLQRSQSWGPKKPLIVPR